MDFITGTAPETFCLMVAIPSSRLTTTNSFPSQIITSRDITVWAPTTHVHRLPTDHMVTSVLRDTQPFHVSRSQTSLFRGQHSVPRDGLFRAGSFRSEVCMWATCLPPLRACTLLVPQPPPTHLDLTCPRAVFPTWIFHPCAPACARPILIGTLCRETRCPPHDGPC